MDAGRDFVAMWRLVELGDRSSWRTYIRMTGWPVICDRSNFELLEMAASAATAMFAAQGCDAMRDHDLLWLNLKRIWSDIIAS